ncbi:MAG: LysR family transcriptional regulator [Proteobacteria bacterium]|nr:LysR family transcriptional regulator [Pseudomonadota bacterium]
MNLTHLRSLLAVAECGSFTAAAEAIGVTQSGVSQAVAALEESLGVTLVVRHRRGADLTAAGERVAAHARTALDALGRIKGEADAARGLASGTVRLAGFPSVFATLLPPLLRRFRTRHPEVRVVALETDDREVERWLAAGKIDLGVVMNPAPGRAAASLGRDAWVPVLPAGHPLAQRPAVSLAELARQPFVLATGGCETNARSLAEAAGAPLKDVQIEVRDWASAIALVREGAGVSLVPESTLPEVRRGLRVAALKAPLHRRFGLVLSPAREPSRAVRAFVAVTTTKAAAP